MTFRRCLAISVVANVAGLFWFGLMLQRAPADTFDGRTVVRIVSAADLAAAEAATLQVRPADSGQGRGAVGPRDRTGTYGMGGEAEWHEAGPLSDVSAVAPGASMAAPGERGSPAPGPNERDTAGLGGSDELPTPSPHEVVDTQSDDPPQPAAHGAGIAGQRPVGDLSPDPVKPSSVTAGQKGPGESAPGVGRPASGDGSGPGAGPGPGGTATPDAQPTVQPGQRDGVGGGGGASGGVGGGAGGGTIGATGQGGTGGGPGRGSADSGTGTGGGGGKGPAAGSPAGGAGNAGVTPAAATTPPSLVAGPPPPRTREMERLERHGSIRVKVKVDANGNPISAVAVTQSGYPEYDSSAADWVRSRWRFKPALRNGQAVAGEVTVTVRY